jgi:hypothetical protein
MLTYYEAIYHVANRKYRNLEHTLKNLKFLKSTDNIIITLSMAVNFINNQQNRHIKVAILHILHEYIHTIVDHLCENIGKNKSFLKQVGLKQNEFKHAIISMKGLPKYIKKMALEKISSVNEYITYRLSA